ncbi:DUF6192 family protein [Streptomyces sp. SID12488]|uniref:DUF6192 family protein n=1 Tax=Streptomyces sp. SID12488 TaxID=2706040 RepID=UPI001EF3931F|nr:DUF6192 family protein [Streptomyces sp. SID12488]
MGCHGSRAAGCCGQRPGRRLSEDEREVIHRNVDRVRATCEWIVTAVDSGHLDMDEELTKLLRGEKPCRADHGARAIAPASTPRPSDGC